MQIVLLCGGLGTRLKQIDNKNPKGLIDINNKPFIYYLLNSIKKYSFSSIHFCLGYKGKQFIDFINNLENLNNITYSLENENNLLGTGGAIKNCLNFLENNFIVQYGDTILEINYEKLYKYHLLNQKPMTMTIIKKELSKEKPNLFCKLNLNDDMECIYNKKNPQENSNYIDYGAIVFNKKIFINIKKKVFDLSEIQTKLSKNKEARYYIANHPYTEIGNPSSYRDAIKKLNDFSSK